MDEDPLKQALGIPMEKHIYCIAPVGVPLYQPKQRPREEFSQKFRLDDMANLFRINGRPFFRLQ